MTGTQQNPFGTNPFDPQPGLGMTPPAPGALPTPLPGDETNTLATLSLVFAFVFAPAGAVLGHLGLSQIARTRQRGRERALVGVTLSYVFITAAVVALVVWAALEDNTIDPPRAAPTSTLSAPAPSTTRSPVTTTSVPPPPPTVAPADLAGLLPTVEDDKRITGNLNLTLTETDDHITPDEGTVDNENCRGVLMVAFSRVYDLSSVTGAAINDIRDLTDATINPFGTTQSVVAFRDAGAAQRQANALADSWRRCAGGVAHAEVDGRPTTYAVGDPTTDAGGITAVEIRQTIPTVHGNPLRIARLFAVKNNVVIDISSGSRRAGTSQHDIALAIFTLIADKIPGPR